MEIKCDKCGAVSTTVTPETYIEGDIEFTFFRCPECSEIYPICATDSALRKDIAGYRRMRMIIKNQKVTEKFIFHYGNLYRKAYRPRPLRKMGEE